jgi:bleomycin hydrolase
MNKNQASAKLRNLIFVFAIFFATSSVYSCSLEPVPEDYEWEIGRTEVKNQGTTGTCWAFSGISFLESECIRKNTATDDLDLSEAYVVYYAFLEKARVYLETMGDRSFSEDGWSNDVFYIIGKYGIVREEDYYITESYKAELSRMPLFIGNDNFFAINRLSLDSMESIIANQYQITPSILQQMYTRRLLNRLSYELDSTIKTYQNDGAIPEQVVIATLENIKIILNEEIGSIPEEITYDGNVITPLDFCQNILGIQSEDYVHITSFENLGFNEIVQLPPDWFVNGQYINVDTELFYELTRLALTLNYGLVIECKSLEAGFHPIAGKAHMIIYPDEMNYEKIEGLRVKRYLKGGMTSNNHLMHMVGFDETLTPWFLIKNSYGDMFGTIPLGTKAYRGHINMSRMYFLLNTVYVTVHKDMLEYFPEIDF